MDSDTVFKKYLGTWPDAFIMWPTKGQEKVKNFFWSDPNDPYVGKEVFDDFLDYIKEECTGREINSAALTASEWLMKYFRTVRGRIKAKKYMARHEPMLAITGFGVVPLKDLMDGFIKYVIENREAL